MILPLDKSRRDSQPFQFSPKPLRDYIAPNHILLKIDELFDFSYVVDLVKPYYCPDNPAFGGISEEPKAGGPNKISVAKTKRYQNSKGKLPLSPVDPDARWQAKSKRERATLCYKDNLLVDDEGFILAEEVTFSTCCDPQVAEKLIQTLPSHPTPASGGKASNNITCQKVLPMLIDNLVTHVS